MFTAICKIIENWATVFDNFSVVNRYKNPLESVARFPIILQIAVLAIYHRRLTVTDSSFTVTDSSFILLPMLSLKVSICLFINTAILIIIEGRFQAFQRISRSKLVLQTVGSRFAALNYHENGGMFVYQHTIVADSFFLFLIFFMLLVIIHIYYHY